MPAIRFRDFTLTSSRLNSAVPSSERNFLTARRCWMTNRSLSGAPWVIDSSRSRASLSGQDPGSSDRVAGPSISSRRCSASETGALPRSSPACAPTEPSDLRVSVIPYPRRRRRAPNPAAASARSAVSTYLSSSERVVHRPALMPGGRSFSSHARMESGFRTAYFSSTSLVCGPPAATASVMRVPPARHA